MNKISFYKYRIFIDLFHLFAFLFFILHATSHEIFLFFTHLRFVYDFLSIYLHNKILYVTGFYSIIDKLNKGQD